MTVIRTVAIFSSGCILCLYASLCYTKPIHKLSLSFCLSDFAAVHVCVVLYTCSSYIMLRLAQAFTGLYLPLCYASSRLLIDAPYITSKMSHCFHA